MQFSHSDWCFCFFFFNDTATTEIYTRSIVGSVRCVQETGINAEYMGIYIMKMAKKMHNNLNLCPYPNSQFYKLQIEKRKLVTPLPLTIKKDKKIRMKDNDVLSFHKRPFIQSLSPPQQRKCDSINPRQNSKIKDNSFYEARTPKKIACPFKFAAKPVSPAKASICIYQNEASRFQHLKKKDKKTTNNNFNSTSKDHLCQKTSFRLSKVSSSPAFNSSTESKTEKHKIHSRKKVQDVPLFPPSHRSSKEQDSPTTEFVSTEKRLKMAFERAVLEKKQTDKLETENEKLRMYLKKIQNQVKETENAIRYHIQIDDQKSVPKQCSCLLYTSPSPRDLSTSRMPSSA
eukprot:TRINITY_DN17067_c0_g1_i4.p1 TRINITY_DN17067_c0_g1~~TRINITY_DN17067_c0_g1_i4.p1  ORF type:complete len:344 (+),score=67.05 TRINITY_DN17067_c0_g1_i4:87-1118(+)